MFFKFSVFFLALLLQLLALFLLCLIVVAVNGHEDFEMWATSSTPRATRRQELELRTMVRELRRKQMRPFKLANFVKRLCRLRDSNIITNYRALNISVSRFGRMCNLFSVTMVGRRVNSFRC